LTLVEIMVTSAILLGATITFVAGMLSATHLHRLNTEKATARREGERILTQIRDMPGIVPAYQRFGGGGPGERFAVVGLASPAQGEPVGRIVVWRRKSGAPPDPASPFAWTPADLAEIRSRFSGGGPLPFVGKEGTLADDYLDTNRDGFVDENDSPSLMPVTVRIRWRSGHGIVTEYFSAVIGGK
jgi:hypothetical protein